MALDPFVIGVSRLRRQLGATQEVSVVGAFDADGSLVPSTEVESRVPAGADATFAGLLECIPGGIAVTGQAWAPWEGLCRRCARAVGGNETVEVRERYLESAEEGDEEAYPLVGDLLDLGPAIRDAVILSLPLAPLCDEDCKGLCAQCGADLNEASCTCKAPIDPRWATLDLLRSQD